MHTGPFLLAFAPRVQSDRNVIQPNHILAIFLVFLDKCHHFHVRREGETSLIGIVAAVLWAGDVLDGLVDHAPHGESDVELGNGDDVP